MKPLSKKKREWIKRQLAAIKAGEELRQIGRDAEFLFTMSSSLLRHDPLVREIARLFAESDWVRHEPKDSAEYLDWEWRRKEALNEARRRVC